MTTAPNFLQVALLSVLNSKLKHDVRSTGLEGKFGQPAPNETTPLVTVEQAHSRALKERSSTTFDVKMGLKRKLPFSPQKALKDNQQSARSAIQHGAAEEYQNAESGVKKAKSHPKNAVKAKKRIAVDHPLFLEYKDASVNWTTEASKNLDHDLNSAVDDLTTMLANAINLSEGLQLAHSQLITESLKPLDDQILRIRLDVGTHDEKAYDARLGDQMARFKEVSNVEHQKLRSLWKEWDRVRREIAGILTSAGTDPDDKYIETVTSLQNEYERERNEIVLKYNAGCTELKNKLEESDKSMEHLRKTQKLQVRQMVEKQFEAIQKLANEEY